MIALGISLASVAAYLFVGWMVMTWDMPALWARARNANKSDYNGALTVLGEQFAATHVHSGAATTFLLWPFRLPFLLAMHSAVKHDPKRLQAELAAQQTRIAELERELRIGRKL